MEIGNRVRELREERGLTQRELGRRAGLSHGAVSHLELGIRMPAAATVEKIARALDIEPGELFKELVAELAGNVEARPGPGEQLRRILEREFEHAYLLAELDDLRGEAAKEPRPVDVVHLMVELGDEVQFLREVFLHLPHYVLDKPKGVHAEVTQEEAALLRGVGQAIQDAWRGARARAYILAAEAAEKERLRSTSNAALRRFTERLDRKLARVGQEVDTALSGA